MDDLFLVRQTAQGNTTAYRFLVLRHQKTVFRLLTAILCDTALAEEIAQETFFRAYKSLATFDPRRETSFSTWLLTIARNLAFNELAKQKTKSKFAVEAFADAVECSRSVEEDMAQNRRLAAVREAMNLLPSEFRSAVTLACMEGYSCAEIARVEGCAEGTVKSRIHRAKKMLRESLSPLLKEEP